MDRFEEMRVFIRIAERSSFTRAADDLQMPRATVTNLIKRLETRLGTRLLERTTRTVRLTHDGEAWYHRCLRLMADMEEAENAFRDMAPQGQLRVNLQGTLASRFVMPALPAFMKRYPQIDLHIGEDDRLVDLVREGVDCVLRAGTLQDSTLIAQRVAALQQVTVASPAYLAQWGEPTTLGDLAQHRAVNYISTASGRILPCSFTDGGEVRDITLTSALTVSGTDVYTAAALAGLGLIQVPAYRIKDDMAAGRLKIVLADLPPPPMPVAALYPHNRQLSPRVRVFVQWLKTCFDSAEPPGAALMPPLIPTLIPT